MYRQRAAVRVKDDDDAVASFVMDNRHHHHHHCRDHQTVRKLGQGAFGSVYLVELGSSSSSSAASAGGRRYVAVKYVPTRDTTADQFEQELQCMEVFRRSSTSIPCSMHVHGAVKDPMLLAAHEPPSRALVMPYFRGTTLIQFLTARSLVHMPIQTGEATKLAEQLATFMLTSYDGAEGFIHNDLKLGNVLISPGGGLCVIDYSFGTLHRHRPMRRWVGGTPCYMPPEHLFFYEEGPGSDRAEESGDVWAAGTLMATIMLTGWPIQLPAHDDDSRCPISPHQILDVNGCFSPGITSTVYHLLPDTVPWLAEYIDKTCSVHRLVPHMVRQAVRLLLWTRALHGPGKMADHVHSLGDPARCPLWRVIGRDMPALVEHYTNMQFPVYERALDVMRGVGRGVLFNAYLSTQQWSVARRVGPLGENPAAILARHLPGVRSLDYEELTGRRRVHRRTRVVVADDVEELLDCVADHDCVCCDGVTAYRTFQSRRANAQTCINEE